MRRVLYDLVPPFALFGPLFVVLAIPGMGLGWTIFALVGALMSGFALLVILLRQREIQARLDTMAHAATEVDDQAETMLVPRRS